ncbi:MAG: isoaspartyl peptidase/L-asparaginase [Bacteroidales bacterium]|nr:isoaspartyl peptidase/L-asparaginase [Bacteroidales bacterium]
MNIKYSISVLFCLVTMLFACDTAEQKEANASEKPAYSIAIHGGAGVILKENMSDELEAQYRSKLLEALSIGEKILADGGTCLDAVEQTIWVMENSPLFNAGKGAVFTHHGTNELDASIMNGSDLQAGAVAGVGDVKHPISLARKVMTDSDHVLLSGAGASEFAREVGLEIVDSSYFYTEKRWKSLQRALKKVNANKYGTVGCAAMDQYGNLAAGTSTGGMTNKKYNRIGDAPIIGAGTYASNKSCAISATGHGEFFIRYTVAREIAALMEYKQMSLQSAAEEVIIKRLKPIGGDGGIISVDKDGNIALVFNTPGMYRASVKAGEKPYVAIFNK